MKLLYKILIALSIICPIVIVVLALLMKDWQVFALGALVLTLTIQVRGYEKKLEIEKSSSFARGYVLGLRNKEKAGEGNE